ncbi:MAG: hypothetical protein AAF750_14700 [Planctomycetota bacterium]
MPRPIPILLFASLLPLTSVACSTTRDVEMPFPDAVAAIDRTMPPVGYSHGFFHRIDERQELEREGVYRIKTHATDLFGRERQSLQARRLPNGQVRITAKASSFFLLPIYTRDKRRELALVEEFLDPQLTEQRLERARSRVTLSDVIARAIGWPLTVTAIPLVYTGHLLDAFRAFQDQGQFIEDAARTTHDLFKASG